MIVLSSSGAACALRMPEVTAVQRRPVYLETSSRHNASILERSGNARTTSARITRAFKVSDGGKLGGKLVGKSTGIGFAACQPVPLPTGRTGGGAFVTTRVGFGVSATAALRSGGRSLIHEVMSCLCTSDALRR